MYQWRNVLQFMTAQPSFIRNIIDAGIRHYQSYKALQITWLQFEICIKNGAFTHTVWGVQKVIISLQTFTQMSEPVDSMLTLIAMSEWWLSFSLVFSLLESLSKTIRSFSPPKFTFIILSDTNMLVILDEDAPTPATFNYKFYSKWKECFSFDIYCSMYICNLSLHKSFQFITTICAVRSVLIAK